MGHLGKYHGDHRLAYTQYYKKGQKEHAKPHPFGVHGPTNFGVEKVGVHRQKSPS